VMLRCEETGEIASLLEWSTAFAGKFGKEPRAIYLAMSSALQRKGIYRGLHFVRVKR
jgi:hypothetical protein